MTPTSCAGTPGRWPEMLPGLILERRGPVVVLRINAAPLNLLTQTIRHSLGDAFLAAAADEDMRCLVFLPGGRHLCAGADLGEFRARRDPVTAEAHANNAQRMIRALVNCPKPVLMGIEGACLGGGYELALGCDIIVAASDARIGLPEIHRGVWPGTGGLFLLRRRIGAAQAKALAWAGEVLGAETAHRRGLLDSLVGPGEVETTVLSMAANLANAPAGSVSDIKAMIDRDFQADFGAHLNVERIAYVRAFGRADAVEGVAAFQEKREARWEHR